MSILANIATLLCDIFSMPNSSPFNEFPFLQRNLLYNAEDNKGPLKEGIALL